MGKMEEKLTYHLLSKDDEREIYNLIDSRLKTGSGDNAQARRDKEDKKKAFDEFKRRLTSKANDESRTNFRTRLCYEHLPELLDIVGLSYLDILKCISKDPENRYVVPQWASEAEAAMCSWCELLSHSQRTQVLALINRILPDVFRSDEYKSMTPLLRLTKANYLRTYCNAEMRRQTEALGVNDIYLRRKGRFSFNAIELKMIPYMSINFDVSPHWLLGLDESRTVLAGNGETEIIMDMFCFLPEERKQMILQAVQTAVEKGGAV